MWIFFLSREKTLYWFKVGVFCDFRLAVLDYISFGKFGIGSVLRHIVLESEALRKSFVHFPCFWREEKGKKCQNLTMASCFAAYLLGTVGNRVVALSNRPPLQSYTQILPLRRLVFCISLKGTFMEDVKRAESLSHFLRVVAPSRSWEGKPCPN